MRLTKTQRPQRGSVGLALVVIDLVGGQEHRLARSLQNPRGRLIRRSGADNGVHHKDHRVRGLHGHRGLRGHLLLQALGVGFPPAGVLHHEPVPGPGGVVGHPVPGHAGQVLHDRLAATQDPVHQRGLADVGSSYHRHYRRRTTDRSRLLGIGLDAELPLALVGPRAVVGHRAFSRWPRIGPTRSRRAAITSVWFMSLVSTTTASSAARSGETAREESR